MVIIQPKGCCVKSMVLKQYDYQLKIYYAKNDEIEAEKKIA